MLTDQIPRHFGRTSAVAVNLFVAPIAGIYLLWSSGLMQTEDLNYALIKWESLRHNRVCPFPSYPSLLNQQLSGSQWIKLIAIYQKQHMDSLQVRNRPTPPSFPHAQTPKKLQTIQGLLWIMDSSGSMKPRVTTSCHSCLLSKWHLCLDDTIGMQTCAVIRHMYVHMYLCESDDCYSL